MNFISSNPLVNDLYAKGVRYENAIHTLKNKEGIKDLYTRFCKDKTTFKAIVQKFLTDGIFTTEQIEEKMLAIVKSEPAIINFKAKITRYAKPNKLEASLNNSEKKAVTISFEMANENLEKSFLEIRNTDEYVEFRKAKKCIKGDSDKYVGYFKALKTEAKKNRQAFTLDAIDALVSLFLEKGYNAKSKVFVKLNRTLEKTGIEKGSKLTELMKPQESEGIS